jgi:PEP-CTERM/exosortase A-associated glycosyltransferase
MKILHILDHSLPYFSGYSFRSDYIIRAQLRLGLHPVVITSPNHEEFSRAIETIDGVEYHRLRWPALAQRLQNLSFLKQAAWLSALSSQIARLIDDLEVDLVHAHSPSINGHAAARAARMTAAPWIYELRYYDEDAAVDRGKTAHNSIRYRLGRTLEQAILKRAAQVVTISESLRNNLISRGIDESRVSVVPNGVDTSYFQPCEPDAGLKERHSLSGKATVGFIGSFYFYEGLEHLVDAVILLAAKGRDLKLLLVGEGEADRMLRDRIPERLRDHFIFTGRVAHADVRRYYSVMDVLVYPRIRSRLTGLTTPLKPLEAMAMEKAVAGSDAGGIRELLVDGETGILFQPGNPQALADRLEELIESESMRRAIGRKARDFVVRNRDWTMIVGRYSGIYQKAKMQDRNYAFNRG